MREGLSEIVRMQDCSLWDSVETLSNEPGRQWPNLWPVDPGDEKKLEMT